MSEVKYVARVARDFQAKISSTEWGPVQKLHINSTEVDDAGELYEKYKQVYSRRLEGTFEYDYGYESDGIYGYKWTYTHIELVKITTTTTEVVINEYKK